jgi:putative flippase GtrA
MRHLAQALRKSTAERPVRQLARYAIVVGCGYLLAVAIYAGQLAIGIAPYLALGIAFILNGLFNFTCLRAWAFPSTGRGWSSDLRRFCVVAAASFVVNYASFAVLYSAIGFGAGTSQRLAIVIAAPVTFLANQIWAFRVHRLEPSPGYEAPDTAARNESYSRM